MQYNFPGGNYFGSSFYQIKTGDMEKAAQQSLELTWSTDTISETTEKVWTWVLFCICCSAQVILHSLSLQRSKYTVCDLWFCYFGALSQLEFCAGHLNYCAIFCLNSVTKYLLQWEWNHSVLRAVVTQRLGLWDSDWELVSLNPGTAKLPLLGSWARSLTFICIA